MLELNITFPDTSSNLPLYRAESVRAATDSKSGALRLAQPLPGWLITLLGLMAVLSVALFASYGSVTRKANLSGVVVPVDGNAVISSTTAGVLEGVLVREGEVVKAGQALFEIANERRTNDGNTSKMLARELDTRRIRLDEDKRLRHQQFEQKLDDLKHRGQNLLHEFSVLADEIKLARMKRELAERTKRRFDTLLHDGDVSIVQAQQTQEDLIEATSRLKALERSRVQLEKNRITLNTETEAAETSLKADLNRIDASIAALQQEILENGSRHNNILSAPRDGKITAIAYEAGQTVMAGQMLAHLLPLSSGQQHVSEPMLEVHLYAASRTAGFIEPGQAVLLRLDAYPYQKFGMHKGIVTEMSLTPFAPTEMPTSLLANRAVYGEANSTSATATGETLYRVKVKLSRETIQIYKKTHRLKPGMTLSATISLDRRAVWEWIAEPLLAVARQN